MRHNQSKKTVTAMMARAQTAFSSGKLQQYKPLEASGAEGVKSTCAASWGPAMRR
ncbi:hypothetical protein [Zobellella endophytica]|uniref:hypothetical protein n=1 Tax=Zobellella endophytica TaxID=2116700 RepID=UPI001304BB72|nr:hypothetical protein [Zobellella endophytica]